MKTRGVGLIDMLVEKFQRASVILASFYAEHILSLGIVINTIMALGQPNLTTAQVLLLKNEDIVSKFPRPQVSQITISAWK